MSWQERAVSSVFLAVLASFLASAAAEEKAAETAAPETAAAYDELVEPSDREHWSYLPVKRPAVPEVKNRGWVRNPIDAFILAQLEQKGWEPSPPAPPRALLRRLSLDVIGLPPTIDEQVAFLNDRSPAAFATVVDALLKRPGYGERWARHWLDLVRYAETNGYERDATKPHVWRYRDYVINALNNDKPYDRFVLEQLAGDELPDANMETLIATGFYRLGPWDDEPADPQQDRFDQLDDMIRTTSEVFLGMTLGCSRCHNHKFDAITMHDYYRMVAIFNVLDRPRSGRTELDLPAGSREQLAAQEQRDREIARLKEELSGLRTLFRREYLRSGKSSRPADVLEAFQAIPDSRTPEQKALVEQNASALEAEIHQAMPPELRSQLVERENRISQLQQMLPDLPRGYFMRETPPAVPASFLLLRGRASNPGPEVQPGFPTVLVPQQPQFAVPGEHTSRRRLTLARWISSPDNPLTARVIVNRVWQHHFGQALVETPNDFGILGDFPTHPELLDWLAHWFVHEAGWSLKKLHRLVLTSNTYQMSKQWNDEHGRRDPANRNFWRFPYSRLEVEAIRDSMLAVSGQLNRRMHGPSVYLYVPKDALAGHSDPDKIWKPFDEAEASRRTIYAFIKRSLVVPLLEVLDLCDSTRSAERRNVTSVPTQALTLFNGDFSMRQSQHFAARLEQEAGDEPAAQVERAYLLALCRPPTKDELQTMREFLDEETTRLQAEAAATGDELPDQEARHRALVQMCRVIFNLNEFVYAN